MFEIIELNTVSWILLFSSAVLIGMSKTGVQGVSLIVIPMLAMVFGGKNSTGVILPMLIFADVFGVSYYHRHAEWKHVLRALPWAIVGVALAMLVGNIVSDQNFKELIALIVFAGVGIMIWRDVKKFTSTPDQWWFAAVMGLAGGFATMIGNAAGPVFAIYLLALRLPKDSFIGTTAWFFAIINILKVPFHIFGWNTISLDTFLLDLTTIPFVALGAFLGVRIVKIIKVEHYRWFVIGITLISAILMVI